MVSDKPNTKAYKKLEEYIDAIPDKSNSLITVLHKAQELFGYLPHDVQKFVAKKLDQPVAKVNGVVTFYSYFTENPTGQNVINVCMGTACFVKGSADILEKFEQKLGIKAGETTKDNKFTLEVLRCVGACGLAPVVTINDKVYGHFTKEMVDTILQEYSKEEVTS